MLPLDGGERVLVRMLPGHLLLEVSPTERRSWGDPEMSREIVYLMWIGNTMGTLRRDWEVLL